MESKALASMKMIMCVALLAAMVVAVAEGVCPTVGQLSGACGQYVTGSNPPVPPFNSGCCSLLKSSNAACLCSNVPPAARALVSKKGLVNIRNACKIGAISCPGARK